MHRAILVAVIALVVAVSGVGMGVVAAPATDSPTAQVEPTCEFPLAVEDGTGEEIELDEEPERIVAISPSDAQVLFEIGVEDRVVGMPVGAYTDYLDGHDEPGDISGEDGLTPNVETVVGLEPDLVLASSVADEDQLAQLRDAGLTVYQYAPAASLDDVYDNVATAGELTGECDGAEETMVWMDEEIGIVEAAIEGEEEPLVLYAMGGGFTAGEGSFTEQIVQRAGGVNLGSEAGIDFYEPISDEVIVEEDPDWIVYPDDVDEPDVSEEVLEATTAGQEGNVASVDAQFANQPGPYVIHAIAELAETFHPDAYAEAAETVEDDADGAAEAQDDVEETDDAEMDDTEADDDAEETDDVADEADDEIDDGADDAAEDQPGFGVVVALVALLLAGLIGAHRR
ncbi:PGF-CTERM-anchored ABC transporter substrate-binding protein [Natronorarus salvus]|uniref:PGF-CTERM-anchored ABC transporter substrate-binding protein n=1 Tax=Natronorarus salvus TaxID=3117733 RepID=UPI002F260B1E